VNVPHSHYFCLSSIANKAYLVVLDKSSSSIKHYAVMVTAASGGKSQRSQPGQRSAFRCDHRRTYEEERQNFANWFTYHRRREFIAKSAIANIILTLADVRVGIYGINRRIVSPLERSR